jgi:predicted O-methyltransferase YrrM
MDPYATHIPLLAAALAAAGPGPVLELGAGTFSTPMLRAICAATGRWLMTVESNPEWFKKFYGYRSQGHAMLQMGLEQDLAQRWAVVFVDNAPAAQRVIDIERLRESCELMVVHDTEEPVYGYEPAFVKFKYRVDYRRMRPWTSILSMTRDLSQFVGI